jgi:DNA polymerase III delta prime subunit
VDYIREIVSGFAVSPFRTEELRLCFIDEADYLSSNAQAALRTLIESSSDQCRFILALNDITKLAEPLRSRLHVVDFTVRQADIVNFHTRLQDWYGKRLDELGITFDRGRLNQIVAFHCPDFRSIANALEFEFGT